MAFFKFRTATEGSGAARQPESIEAMRRRARHRLIGATVLVLAGVVGFPLLFDTQPRPIAVDIPIDIPDRNKAKPLPIPARPATTEPVATGKLNPPSAPAAAGASAARTPAALPASKPAAPAVAKTDTTPATPPKPAAPPAEAKSAPADDGSKAQALLDGKTAKPAAAEGRFVVQVGAFADNAKAHEARLRVEHAGLKTYAQVAQTKDGRRIRVRVGPFATRAEADKAAQKIKGLDLPANILTLS
jgi:DedD protein